MSSSSCRACRRRRTRARSASTRFAEPLRARHVAQDAHRASCSIIGLPRESALPTTTRSGAGSRSLRIPARFQRDAERFELRRHRRIDVRVGAFDVVAELARERRDAAHERAADAEDVKSSSYRLQAARRQFAASPAHVLPQREKRRNPLRWIEQAHARAPSPRSSTPARARTPSPNGASSARRTMCALTSEVPDEDREHRPAEQHLQRRQLRGRAGIGPASHGERQHSSENTMLQATSALAVCT